MCVINACLQIRWSSSAWWCSAPLSWNQTTVHNPGNKVKYPENSIKNKQHETNTFCQTGKFNMRCCEFEFLVIPFFFSFFKLSHSSISMNARRCHTAEGISKVEHFTTLSTVTMLAVSFVELIVWLSLFNDLTAHVDTSFISFHLLRVYP